MADRAREALFSIILPRLPGRVFYDLFAGSGAVGMEAISRGASQTVFVEREFRAVQTLRQHLESFGVIERAQVIKADAFRWVHNWLGATEPVLIFLGPPYRVFEEQSDEVRLMVERLLERTAPDSLVIVQSDREFAPELLPRASEWDIRTYGRTQLAFWSKPANHPSDAADPAP
jgi:16S rRNA (guanine(966)-N(2))-methyltransferase RsmD